MALDGYSIFFNYRLKEKGTYWHNKTCSTGIGSFFFPHLLSSKTVLQSGLINNLAFQLLSKIH